MEMFFSATAALAATPATPHTAPWPIMAGIINKKLAIYYGLRETVALRLMRCANGAAPRQARQAGPGRVHRRVH